MINHLKCTCRETYQLPNLPKAQKSDSAVFNISGYPKLQGDAQTKYRSLYYCRHEHEINIDIIYTVKMKDHNYFILYLF